MMKIIFFGSDDFALPSLRLLARQKEDVQIISVVTKPDTRKGRGMKVVPLKIKQLASELGIDVYQPKKFDEETVPHIKSLKPELIVVVAYGKILPKKILEIPPKGCVNLHSSYLPDLRGAGTVPWSIIRGYKYTGVTTMYINEKVDAGDIIEQKKVEISREDTSATLSQKLAEEGAELLFHTLKDIDKGKENVTRQDISKVTYAPLLKKEDGLIDWTKSAEEIFNLVRGLNPWPSAYTYLKGKLFKIHKAQVAQSFDSEANPGEIVKADKNNLVIATGKGDLNILEVQIEDKKKMPIKDFLQGHKLEKGKRFSK
ncbi:MAG: methionyl-tRNA formyltransferase [Candidatus Ratteibacteria bacterium]|nr:methionyl-tRNA formyltransferase [Candidatus Ratteibacteria bacterium]